VLLIVSMDIPYGNAAGVRVWEHDGRRGVSFSPDPHGGPECLWFCFRISSPEGEIGALRLKMKNPDTTLGGGRPENFRPVIRRGEGEWERIGTGRVAERPDGRMSVIWDLDVPAPHCDVAFCYPYGAPEIDALLGDCGEALRADGIGHSQGGRGLVRLSNDYGTTERKRPGLYLVARQHAGEMPGSWVLDGFLREMVRLGSDAPLVWAVPLSNIDGIEWGDYGKDNFPYDLNRAWSTPPMRHETLCIRKDIARWQARCRAELAIDFHAPGGSEAAGAYCFTPTPQSDADMGSATARWAETIRHALGETYAAEEFLRTADYPSRWETMRFTQFCWSQGVPALTIETPYALSGETVMTRERYREMGSLIARRLSERLSG